MDGYSLFLVLVCFALTFVVARAVGKRLRARRGSEQARKAESELAQQSRQVRRAAARKKPG